MMIPYQKLLAPDPLRLSVMLYLTANAAMRFLGVVRIVLLTWLMSRAQLGIYQLGLLGINILLPLFEVGLHEGMARFVPLCETQGHLLKFVKNIFIWASVISLLTCGMCFLFADAVGPALFGTLESMAHQGGSSELDTVTAATLTRWVSLCIWILIHYHLVQAFLRGRRMFRAVSVMELSNGVAFTAAALLAAAIGYNHGVTILGLYAAISAMCLVLFGFKGVSQLAREPEQRSNLATETTMLRVLRFSIWAGLGLLFWQVLLVYPAWHLNRITGVEMFAVFSTMAGITQIGYIISAAYGMGISSAINKTWEMEGEAAAVARLNWVTRLGSFAILIFCLLLAMAREWLILLFDEAFRVGLIVFQIQLVFYMLAGILNLLIIRFSLLKNSLMTFMCWAVGLAVVVAYCQWQVQGDSPQDALYESAIAGVLAISATILVALALLAKIRFFPDKGVCLVIASTYLLLAPTPYLLAGTALLLVIAWRTRWIAKPEEGALPL